MTRDYAFRFGLGTHMAFEAQWWGLCERWTSISTWYFHLLCEGGGFHSKLEFAKQSSRTRTRAWRWRSRERELCTCTPLRSSQARPCRCQWRRCQPSRPHSLVVEFTAARLAPVLKFTGSGRV